MGPSAATLRAKARAAGPSIWARVGDPRALLAMAFEEEIAARRLFLWLPVAAGAGVVLHIEADHEPSLVVVGLCALCLGVLALRLRASRAPFMVCAGLCAVCAGLFSAGWRTARVAAPAIDRIRIATLEGFVEEMDYRRNGARFILRLAKADGLEPAQTPYRVRLTVRRTPPFDAGAYVSLKARLVPPARAAQPGGYDFARDAWFARLGAVGNVLGRVDEVTSPVPPGLQLAAMMALDRGRNALARRVDAIVGGDAGAIAAAMVTGKRDLLSEEAKDLIREAGIFHIITISGVQMTLVAAIFFIGLRRLLALSPGLALQYPIKKWAALAAMAGACFYDVATGSRVGTERALIMTLIMLGAVVLDRQALTMRNLALAACVVICLEPEAIMGASFQLSFAAVAALVAVYEARLTAFAAARAARDALAIPVGQGRWHPRWEALKERLRHGPGAVLFATLCATSATASFMAYDFHELSPYVLLGNPLTLTIIEIFAVPGALLGTLLYPFGLDAWIWHYVGLGIAFVMWAAKIVGGLPGATVHLPAFAPWSLAFLTLAVLSAVIWRTTLLRATAIPLALVGLCGAAAGPQFDMAVAASGDAAALRRADGTLLVLGHRPSLFAAEQWLRADADGRSARAAVKASAEATACDKLGCIGRLADGRAVALVLDKAAFAEDCTRAAILVTPLLAPQGCAAQVFDRERLAETGAVTLKFEAAGTVMRTARAVGEDRPWSRAPRPAWGRAVPNTDAEEE